MKAWFGVATLVLAALGCSPSNPQVGVYQGDGTALASFDAHSDGADPFVIDVVFPSTSDGRPTAGVKRGVVLLAADGIATEHYRWLAQALGRSNAIVALPEMDPAGAQMDPHRARIARDLLSSDSGIFKGTIGPKIAIVGHGEGAIVAVDEARADAFSAVVLLGAGPSTGAAISSPSMIIAGTSDCSNPASALQASWPELAAPSFFVELVGATNSQFTDDDSVDRASCVPGASIDAVHAQIASSLSGFLGFALAGDTSARADLEAPRLGRVVESR